MPEETKTGLHEPLIKSLDGVQNFRPRPQNANLGASQETPVTTPAATTAGEPATPATPTAETE